MATATGLYDPSSGDYHPDLLRRCRISRDRLAPISDAPLTVVPRMAKRFPCLAEVPWYPAIGDGAANNLGVGAVVPGVAAMNVGTSAAVRIIHAAPIGTEVHAPLGLFCYRLDVPRCLIGGAASNAGTLRAWCLANLRVEDGPDLETELAKRPTPEHGLTVLPAWLAERAPSWRDDVQGTIVGITQATTAIDLLQAITESGYQRLASIVDCLPNQGRGLRFLVGGGIQRSAASFQRLCNIIGQPLTACEEAETSLRGAAVLAGERLGRRAVLLSGTTIRPNASVTAAYRAQRLAMQQLESRTFG